MAAGAQVTDGTVILLLEPAVSDRVTIYEMSPRDGLQNESRPIPTPKKIALVDLLSGCGFSHIEVASFVSPKWVPQMADGAQVLAGIVRAPGVTYGALVPNLKGYAAARAARASEVAIFASASESFSQRNINCSIAESLARFAPVAEAAARDGVPLRGYVSCVTDCPFEGAIAPQSVARVTDHLLALGCREVSLGDTIGHGTPDSVGADAPRGAGNGCAGAAGGAFPRHARAGARQHRRGARAWACGSSTPPAAGSAAAPSRRARKEMSRPNGWLRGSGSAVSPPASTSGGWRKRLLSPAGSGPPAAIRSARIHPSRAPRRGAAK